MVDLKSRWLNDTGLKPITADENPASLQALRRCIAHKLRHAGLF